MNGDKKKFIELNPKDGGHVTFGDNSKVTIKGIGKISTSTSFISDVYYIEELIHDLLSISQFCDKGNKVSFKKDKCLVKNENDELVLEGHINRNSNVANIVNIPSTSVIALGTKIDGSWPWHKRLGHTRIDSLNKLVKKNLMRGLPGQNFVREQPCDVYQIGKIYKTSFKDKNVVSTSRPLQLINMDLIGPTQTLSLNGKHFTLVVVDDYSRLTWIDFLAYKDDAFPAFVKLYEKVPKGQGYSIIKIRSDHGGEFENSYFEEYFTKHGSQPQDQNLEENLIDLNNQEEPPINEVWTLVPRPHNQQVLGTKWVFRNKANEANQVEKNKARLVAKGYNQEECIDFEETYAPMTKLEVSPRAWYERLSEFLKNNGYKRESIDKTLFTKNHDQKLFIVQNYVDDIIFGSTNVSYCDEFASIMKNEFEMSLMGELTFFLGLQVIQVENGTFINQSRYTKGLLKKFNIENLNLSLKLDSDNSGRTIDKKSNTSNTGYLLYLLVSTPDIMFSICLCARYQSDTRESHLVAVKRICSYLLGTPNLGLWYSNSST
ncbi:uncharacterized protein [Aristolochia californica]|uniref:uncharacterized protein n=1 Tax=Aristolochia californica TaxID=171875 RepID=UPI0035DE9941